MAVALTSAVLWTIAFLATQASLLHWVVPRNPFKVTVLAFAFALAGNTLSVSCTIAGTTDIHQGLLRAVYADLAMLCAFILYMPFYYTVAASLSVQTVIALARTPHGMASLPTLYSHFASMSILEVRLQSMVVNGYLTRHEDNYRLTRKGSSTAWVFQCFKKCWRLGPGG